MTPTFDSELPGGQFKTNTARADALTNTQYSWAVWGSGSNASSYVRHPTIHFAFISRNAWLTDPLVVPDYGSTYLHLLMGLFPALSWIRSEHALGLGVYMLWAWVRKYLVNVIENIGNLKKIFFLIQAQMCAILYMQAQMCDE